MSNELAKHSYTKKKKTNVAFEHAEEKKLSWWWYPNFVAELVPLVKVLAFIELYKAEPVFAYWELQAQFVEERNVEDAVLLSHCLDNHNDPL